MFRTYLVAAAWIALFSSCLFATAVFIQKGIYWSAVIYGICALITVGLFFSSSDFNGGGR